MCVPAHLLARALTGTTYAVLGFDAVRAPGGRVDLAAPMLTAMRRIIPFPKNDELVVRCNAAVQTVAGAALAVGVLPRPAALALIGSLVPTTFAGHAFWRIEDPMARKAQQVQFVKNLALVGGLVFAAIEPRSRPRTVRRDPSRDRKVA